MTLPVRRLFNLMWHASMRGLTEEQRAEVMDAIAEAPRPVARAAARPGRAAPVTDLGQERATRGRSTVPGTATHGIRPPSWWKGDRAAWRNGIRAGLDLGEPAAKTAGSV